jgi:hypothetical protein
MDQNRGGGNNQQWQRFTSNANNNNAADENDSEEKTSPGLNLPPTSDTITAQHVLQQSLLQQLQEEERQRRQQLQIYQFIQNQQREAQLQRLYEQELQNSRLFVGELSVERRGILQLRLQQHQLEQERRLLEEQLLQQQSNRLLQQQLLRGHQPGQSVESLLQRERQQLSILNRNNPAVQFDVSSIHGQSIFEDTRSITSNANIAAVDASVADLARVDAGRHPQGAADVSALPEARSPQTLLLRPWSETSAELLKKMESEHEGSDHAAPRKKSATRKKSADMVRPLKSPNHFNIAAENISK